MCHAQSATYLANDRPAQRQRAQHAQEQDVGRLAGVPLGTLRIQAGATGLLLMTKPQSSTAHAGACWEVC
jgi:hypothetical protein